MSKTTMFECPVCFDEHETLHDAQECVKKHIKYTAKIAPEHPVNSEELLSKIEVVYYDVDFDGVKTEIKRVPIILDKETEYVKTHFVCPICETLHDYRHNTEYCIIDHLKECMMMGAGINFYAEIDNYKSKIRKIEYKISKK